MAALVDSDGTIDVENETVMESGLTEIVSEVKPVRLSLHLIVKRHLPKDATEWPQDKIISELNKIKRVRLDRENIGVIDSLELFSTQVTNLYLQSNKICTMQNLECLPNLQVLVLSNNRIKDISGIAHLEKLLFLDLSENCLENVTCDNLPKNIIILDLRGNSSVAESVYRLELIRELPKLKQLDGVEISVREKISAGVVVEWDEKDNDSDVSEDDQDNAEEEDKELTESRMADPGSSSVLQHPSAARGTDLDTPQAATYRQLPKIESSIQGLAADMLLRSQKRLEDVALQHKRHLQQITNIKIKSKIRPIPQISKPE